MQFDENNRSLCSMNLPTMCKSVRAHAPTRPHAHGERRGGGGRMCAESEKSVADPGWHAIVAILSIPLRTADLTSNEHNPKAHRISTQCIHPQTYAIQSEI